ncbi:MAG TPA: hypothetical protein DCG42_10020 [Maribacter sp.]|uniref:DUF6503 family protein n=1 Tax=unclassified Maribacter TaxID=2615042 RepID=UPI000ED43450|nr:MULTISPECIES: DUF6503 family protein [unclassified Maribacter]HAF77645.1 hypothetical protein [Maribacter sp.]HAI44346.1 hypothetical protein [Maribacter sp.]|tara:strand:- start:3760 stop:4476 length:717 start_codon:yes stop_codon:yes gene_type:complete
MKYVLLSVFLLHGVLNYAQEITGTQLLERAIAYHDPENNWSSFKGKMLIEMENPKSSLRSTVIEMKLPNNYFKSTVKKDNYTIESELDNGECTLKLNGSTSIFPKIKDSLNISCDRAKMMKNYYTYLYGLPMKLKDPGTIIDNNVVKKTFKGKEYLVLKATYEKEVGNDTWYFYFDPKTYAMEVYQFFHDESKNDGEYILLSEMITVNGIKIPKVRAWYYNKGDVYLATDNLRKANSL